MPETFRAVAVVRHDEATDVVPFELAVLPHDERRVRRRLIPLVHGDGVLVDFPQTLTLDNRDRLRLDDGRLIEIIAAEEYLYDVRGRDELHVMRLAWHLGNRHLKAQIERLDGTGPLRILILRDRAKRMRITQRILEARSEINARARECYDRGDHEAAHAIEAEPTPPYEWQDRDNAWMEASR